MDLSIVIVSYNARAHLERCLASLQAHPPASSFEVVVVDNASTDGSAEAAAAFAGVRVIRSATNTGFSVANNIGIEATSGAHILLLNSDTTVPPGAINALLERLGREPDVAVVGPRLVDGQGRPELSFGPMITPFNEWRQGRLVHGLASGDAAVVAQVEAMTRVEQRPDWVSGACLLVGRADAEAVGLLDERYFLYAEDVDFCAALRGLGRRILFTPDAQVVHLRGASGRSRPAATERAYRESQLAFYAKHHPRWVPVLRVYLRLRGRLPAAASDRA